MAADRAMEPPLTNAGQFVDEDLPSRGGKRRGGLRFFTALGAWLLSGLAHLGRAGVFLAQTLYCGATPPFKLRLGVKQIWFIGWKSIGVICLMAVFSGMVLALQAYPTLRQLGSEGFLGPLVAVSLIRELGPVLSALMVTGRAGSSIAAEIGIMRTNEQIEALELMGLNPLRYLVTPNLLACLVALPLLAAIFDVAAILGGYLVGVRLLGLNTGTYFGEMSTYVRVHDILGGLYKSASFGLLVAWVCCYKGYYTRPGAQGVSVATTQAVVNASVLILACDYFVTSLLF
jgi:phospholipid/cholesterol/gamma-HCH transport system permease protein